VLRDSHQEGEPLENPPQVRLRTKTTWAAGVRAVLDAPTKDMRSKLLKEQAKDKAERKAAYDHLRALDHALRLVGLGLADFVPEQDGTWVAEPPGPLRPFEQRLWVAWQHEWPYPVPPEHRARGKKSILLNQSTGEQKYELPEFVQERPCLALYGDEGSKFLSCVPFLQHHLKARVVWLRDPAHRQWNDYRNAVKHVGLRPLFYEMCLALNMRHGPWLSCSFFQQLRGGMEEPRAASRVGCLSTVASASWLEAGALPQRPGATVSLPKGCQEHVRTTVSLRTGGACVRSFQGPASKITEPLCTAGNSW